MTGQGNPAFAKCCTKTSFNGKIDNNEWQKWFMLAKRII